MSQATVSIPSDELRRLGLGMSKEGAAVALPLRTPEGGAMQGAHLHCYVHAGYVQRRVAERDLESSESSPPGTTEAAIVRVTRPSVKVGRQVY